MGGAYIKSKTSPLRTQDSSDNGHLKLHAPGNKSQEQHRPKRWHFMSVVNCEETIAESDNVIIIDASKGEGHKVAKTFRSFSQLIRDNVKQEVVVKKHGWSSDLLAKASLLIIPCPRQSYFQQDELYQIETFMYTGGSVLFLFEEGHVAKHNININDFLTQFGIHVNQDAVISSVPSQKYLHPKEVPVSSGVINPCFFNQHTREDDLISQGSEKMLQPARDSQITFVYPYGCTLNVKAPAVPILSSGKYAYPLNRPVLAIAEKTLKTEEKDCICRLSVIGSIEIFSKDWLSEEQNAVVCKRLLQWLLHEGEANIFQADAQTAGINERYFIPNLKALSERPKCSLSDDLQPGQQFQNMNVGKLSSFAPSNVAEVASSFYELGVEHAPLSLIRPGIYVPLPPLIAAIFPPPLCQPHQPELELFDLDEHFATDQARLVRLANSSSEAKLDEYICKAGEILGVFPSAKNEETMLTDSMKGKAILEHVLREIVSFRCRSWQAASLHDSESENCSLPMNARSPVSNLSPGTPKS